MGSRTSLGIIRGSRSATKESKESQAFESESEKESEFEQGTVAEITEKESESSTESTTADSFVIPLPPQAG